MRHNFKMNVEDEDATCLLCTVELMVEILKRRKKFKFKKKRAKKKKFNQFDWDNFFRHDELHISRTLRMKKKSFFKLVQILTPFIKKKGHHAAISPKLRLFIYLHWARGSSYLDIVNLTGISRASLYRIVHGVGRSILECNHPEVDNIHFPQTPDECKKAAADFQSISHLGVFGNVVCAVDGYLLKLIEPSKKHVGNVRSFFSGHYQCFGMNVQAACDAHCRFVFIGLTAPGVMPDREAVKEVELGQLIENLPLGFVAMADAAYEVSERMCALFYGDQAKKKENDNFNFYGSQLRIRIEMAFGLLNMKWGVLQKPMRMKPNKLKLHLVAIARLHNYVINERLRLQKKGAFDSVQQAEDARKQCRPSTPIDENGDPVEDKTAKESLLVLPSPLIPGHSTVRFAMVRKVKKWNLKRPVSLK